MRAKCAVVAQALLLPLCGKMASAVTQCKDINTCSECSGHTFGCENPGLLEESWPWGTSMADPSIGKMSNATECYFSCGWCPNTFNPTTGEQGMCVQVSHQSHGDSCADTLHCASCTCKGGVEEAGDCDCKCPATGIFRANGFIDMTIIVGEEPLTRPADKDGSVALPKYWVERGNPACPDFHDHISETNKTGSAINANTGQAGSCEGIPGEIDPATSAVYTAEQQQSRCVLRSFGPGGGWRPDSPAADAVLPTYTNIKCGWCANPAPGRSPCQVANAYGVEFEQMGGATDHCHCADSTTGIPALAAPAGAAYGPLPNGTKWCRRCSVGTIEAQAKCIAALEAEDGDRVVEELATYDEGTGGQEVGEKMSKGDPFEDTQFDVTEAMYSDGAKIVYIAVGCVCAIGTVAGGVTLYFRRAIDSQSKLVTEHRGTSEVLALDQATAGAVAAGTTARPIVTVPDTGV